MTINYNALVADMLILQEKTEIIHLPFVHSEYILNFLEKYI